VISTSKRSGAGFISCTQLLKLQAQDCPAEDTLHVRQDTPVSPDTDVQQPFFLGVDEYDFECRALGLRIKPVLLIKHRPPFTVVFYVDEPV